MSSYAVLVFVVTAVFGYLVGKRKGGLDSQQSQVTCPCMHAVVSVSTDLVFGCGLDSNVICRLSLKESVPCAKKKEQAELELRRVFRAHCFVLLSVLLIQLAQTDSIQTCRSGCGS